MTEPRPDVVPAEDLARRRRPLFPGETAAYADARGALLAEEIALRRRIGAVAERRRRLPPGPEIAADYRFLDRSGAEIDLGGLFGARSTLVVYVWMYGPERPRPCPMCVNLLGPLDANARDIGQHVALKVVGRSPVARQEAVAAERGWRALEFVQTLDDRFARDVGALAADGSEAPALIVFRREGETVRLFWAEEINDAMADPGEDPRGAPELAPLWNVLDLTPEGRDPHWYPSLAY